MARITLLTLSIFGPLLANAYNDWSKPCFDGTCSYDLHGAVEGELHIEGSPDAISDITPAAGWWIIGCDPAAEAQDIRLVCINTERCGHLNRSIGPEGKLVRLPENCGRSPFARVVKSWVDKDQTMTAEVKSQLMRRGVTSSPEVRGLTLDTDFAAIDPTITGPVHISIEGTTAPGGADNVTIHTPPKLARRESYEERGFSAIENAFDRFSSYNVDIIKDLPPLDVDREFPIISESFTCNIPGYATAEIKGSIDASLDAKIHAVVQVGVAAEGTIIPPKIDQFGLFAALDAELAGSLNIAASASGKFVMPEITVYEQALPGLDIPGILSVGPVFKVGAKASTTVEGKFDAKLGVSYKIDDAKLYFPKTDRKRSIGGFAPTKTPLELYADPSISAKGGVEAHLIPKIEFGIVALKGLAKATVHLDVDASAAVNLKLDAGASASHTFMDSPNAAPQPRDIDASVAIAEAKPVAVEERDVDASVHGCIHFDAGFDIGAGAKGKFFGLIDDGMKVSLFKQRYDIYQQCWGAATSSRTRRALYHIDPPQSSIMRREIVEKRCFPEVTKMLMLINQVIQPAAIKPKN